MANFQLAGILCGGTFKRDVPHVQSVVLVLLLVLLHETCFEKSRLLVCSAQYYVLTGSSSSGFRVRKIFVSGGARDETWDPLHTK